MSWNVKFKKRATKQLGQLPTWVRLVVEELVDDIKDSGPIRGDWPNYSKLADGSHHCHLTYRYVAVWDVVDNGIKIVEITYVGSRENAPY